MTVTHPSAPAGLSDEYLLGVLEAAGARYRLLDHAPEGRTAEASLLRGHPLAAAAKSIVVRVRLSRRSARYVVCVVPGDRRVDLTAVCDLYGGEKVGFATTRVAEDLTGCVSGSVVPFSFRPELALVADPGLLTAPQIFFNAARLDRSVALNSRDYLTVARPRLARIGE
jgi:Ala-tRNA(Pro) deacylase